jgi:hypothetical protein
MIDGALGNLKQVTNLSAPHQLAADHVQPSRDRFYSSCGSP